MPSTVPDYDPRTATRALSQEMRVFLLGVEADAAAMLDTAGPVPRQFGTFDADTKRSLFTDVEEGERVVVGTVGATAPHALVVHNGRRPGRRMPPTSVIEDWLRRKHRLSQQEAKARAFPVARAIGKRGVRGTPFIATPMLDRLPSLSPGLARAAETALLESFRVPLDFTVRVPL